ncbi:MAG: hypothetical protein ACE5DM_04715 [Candidatus Nanoarchaeia archaeon]
MPDPGARDAKIMAKAQGDIARGSSCVSYNFLRARGEEVDENKFLMPVVGHIPVLAFQIVYCVMRGLNTAVVGSPEVGKVVEAVKSSKGIPAGCLDSLVWADEGDKLNVSNSLMRGAAVLPLDKDDSFGFFAADCPNAFDFDSVLNDPDWKKHVAILNCNGRKKMFPSREFIPRNYYHVLTTSAGEDIEIKEPNLWQFSKEALEHLIEIANTFYAHRQGGGIGPVPVAKTIGKEMLTDLAWLRLPLCVIEDMGYNAAVYLGNQAGLGAQIRFHEKTAEYLGSKLFGGPMRMKADHYDPWRMKDIDARHDLNFYRLLFETAMDQYCADDFSELRRINPYAQEIWSLDGVMSELGIPIIDHFHEIERERLKKLGMADPYDKDGRVIAKPAPGEDIGMALGDLEMRTIQYDNAKAA